MSLGNRIKLAREKLKLTQRQVAKPFNIRSAAVSGWERDKASPAIERLPTLWKLLKVSPEWLLSGSGDPADTSEIATLLEGLQPRQLRQALRILRSLVADSDEAA